LYFHIFAKKKKEEKKERKKKRKEKKIHKIHAYPLGQYSESLKHCHYFGTIVYMCM
jgi:hypothetical protein